MTILDLFTRRGHVRILDLFCGGGGVAVGLYRASPLAMVIGVDNYGNCAKYYPGTFILNDVFKLRKSFLRKFDLIWASPPCTAYSAITNCRRRKDFNYEEIDLVEPTRELLLETGKPYVIENVIGAPIRVDLMLCGLMVGLPLYRHRIFEIEGFSVPQPEHPKHDGQQESSIYGNPRCKRHMVQWPLAMGMDHIPTGSRQFAKAIPPAYSEYILKEFLKNE